MPSTTSNACGACPSVHYCSLNTDFPGAFFPASSQWNAQKFALFYWRQYACENILPVSGLPSPKCAMPFPFHGLELLAPACSVPQITPQSSHHQAFLTQILLPSASAAMGVPFSGLSLHFLWLPYFLKPPGKNPLLLPCHLLYSMFLIPTSSFLFLIIPIRSDS